MLLNLLQAPPSSPLAPLLDWAVRLDNASHVLLWAHTGGGEDLDPSSSPSGAAAEAAAEAGAVGTELTLALLEFPRLGLRFRIVSSSDGSVQLQCMEHKGLHVSHHITVEVASLLSCYTTGVVLENQHQAQILLMPNM